MTGKGEPEGTGSPVDSLFLFGLLRSIRGRGATRFTSRDFSRAALFVWM